MSKLTDFYAHKASLQEEGKPIDPQWKQLEDQLLPEELLPEVMQCSQSVRRHNSTSCLWLIQS